VTDQPRRFQTEQKAARFLFEEAGNVLVEAGVQFVVVGGWVPFLFHAEAFGHPGTFDVDLLIHDSSLDDGSFDRATTLLAGLGYLGAPKNKFQAHRILAVGAEKLVFHVDFLNERAPTLQHELVVGSGKFQSIYTPAMKVVFAEGEFRSHSDFPGFRFPSIATFIVTKGAAVLGGKRMRDAFDVFVTLQGVDLRAFTSLWRERCLVDPLYADSNQNFVQAIDRDDAVLKIQRVLRELNSERMDSLAPPLENYIRGVFSFLSR
jgi:hypothetical protein